jgi:hypothetical protein
MSDPVTLDIEPAFNTGSAMPPPPLPLDLPHFKPNPQKIKFHPHLNGTYWVLQDA